MKRLIIVLCAVAMCMTAGGGTWLQATTTRGGAAFMNGMGRWTTTAVEPVGAGVRGWPVQWIVFVAAAVIVVGALASKPAWAMLGAAGSGAVSLLVLISPATLSGVPTPRLGSVMFSSGSSPIPIAVLSLAIVLIGVLMVSAPSKTAQALAPNAPN